MPNQIKQRPSRSVAGDSRRPVPDRAVPPSHATALTGASGPSPTTPGAGDAEDRRLAADRRRRHLLKHDLASKSLALSNEAIAAIPRIRETLAGPGGQRLSQGQAVSAAILLAAGDDWRRQAWAAFETRAAERGLELRDYLRRLWALDARLDEDAR